MKRWLSWYQQNFPLFMTISTAVLSALFVKQIPYVNLLATYFATAVLAFVMAIVITITGNTLKTNIKILTSILVMTFLLDILTFSYQSEILGNLFYILLIYITVRESISLRKK